MGKFENEIIYTIIAVTAIVVARLLIDRVIVNRILKKNFDKNRKRIIAKVINLISVIMLVTICASIWSVDGSQLILFITSVLTVLGVAFFAQWSHLSNITSGIIVFFDSSIKIGDHISILDKDFQIEGVIEDIEMLFIKIRTDNDELISIPNNIILQKPVRVNIKTERAPLEEGADDD